MKKLLALILAVLMLLSVFTACGKDDSAETEKPTKAQTEQSNQDGEENESSGDKKKYCSHVDENKDHLCDKCKVSVVEHEDPDNDGNHICDHCGVTLTTCKDSDGNHACDDCGATTQHDFKNGFCSICKSAVYVRNGNKITFGSYPQTEVTEESLVATLNSKVGTLPTNGNAQDWTSYGYYIINSKDYMWYIDIVEGSEKYRGVYFTDYRVHCPGYEESINPSYQDDNGYTKGKVYWFKYEPISWTILEDNTESGASFILCDMIIDSQEYYKGDAVERIIENETIYLNNYAHSTIRKWLNETFYNMAFNELQKQLIITTIVDNSAETTGNNPNIYACENTQDKVFLPSRQDVVNSAYGFSTNGYDYDPARYKKATDYARSQGTYTNSGLIEQLTNNSRWWLRSPYYDNTFNVRVVLATGRSDYYLESTKCSSIGVLPALQINLGDTNHTCVDAANDGDHKCDGCISIVTTCNDGDANHVCDDCGVMTPHNYQNGVCTICNDALYTRVGNKITFGSYPQTRVDERSLITTLNNKAGTLPTVISSGKWTSYGYYIEGEVSNFMWYIDVVEGNEKYRGVYFTSYRPSTTAASSTEHSIQRYNGYITGNVYWFRYEPITWTILSEDTINKTAVILCDMVIDSQVYHIDSEDRDGIDGTKIYANNYEYSTIRKWLNETFYNAAFSEFQRQLIITTTVDNSQASAENHPLVSNGYVCDDTEDKIFLLSYQDVNGKDYNKKSTDYAQVQGVETNDDVNNLEGYGNSSWWLRTPYLKIPYGGYNVEENGFVHDVTPVSKTCIGVVPALQIKLYDSNHDCVDVANDDDHKCDECEVILSVCKDTDKDHKCDECRVTLTVCEDYNKDHDCDKCGENVGIHADSANDGDHSCDYCNVIIDICIDSDSDELCDECGCNGITGIINPSNYYTRDGKKITFGSYPQSMVTEESLINKLNDMVMELPTKESSGNWTSYGYYKDGSNEEKFMWYIDLEDRNDKYRGVYFTSYRPNNNSASSSTDNSFQDNNGYSTSTVYWFKYEPISWTILDEDTANGIALILCDMVIDAQEYYISLDNRTPAHGTVYPNNYASSTIIHWLNSTFFDTAFNYLQWQIILYTMVDNSAESTAFKVNDYACSNAESKIFLLSYQDVRNSEYGFSSENFESDVVRQKKSTDYAQSQGVYTSSMDGYKGNSMWWLRSPVDYAEGVCGVTEMGSVNAAFPVYNTNIGVVPALRIKL